MKILMMGGPRDDLHGINKMSAALVSTVLNTKFFVEPGFLAVACIHRMASCSFVCFLNLNTFMWNTVLLA